MSQDLVEAFRCYTDVVQTRLSTFHKESGVRRHLELVRNAAWLRNEMERLEREGAFQRLVEATYAVFLSQDLTKGKNLWEHAVKKFFRRSGYYLDATEGIRPSHDAIFDIYQRSFQETTQQIRYLAPIEFVQFAKPCMEFGTFQIRRFTHEELATILYQRVNEVFYPHAAIDVDKLVPYSFIEFQKENVVPHLRRTYIDLNGLSRVDMEYTRYGYLEPILQHLALFEWTADFWQGRQDDKETGWLGFHIPFVLVVEGSLLGSPRSAPDLSQLSTEPWFDAQTREEIGEVPSVAIDLDDSETATFENVVQRTGHLLATIRGKQQEWAFLEIALNFFGKAFFADGLEQLLWHITTLEALLGEKGEGVTNKLARRIAAIAGKNQKERQAISQRFKKLYEFRSNLVHGNYKLRSDKVHVGHLREARHLARITLLWFLEFLNDIQASNNASVPVREDLLTLLDLDQGSRSRLGRLIASAPAGFPHIPEWLG